MTKEEAFAKENEGKKLTHRYFTEEEWVMIKDEEFIFEDGAKCVAEIFWMCRNDKAWDYDWEFFNN